MPFRGWLAEPPIDLYFICKEKGCTVAELITKAKAKFDWHIDPIQLGTQFVKAEETLDLPAMIRDIPPQEWQAFFIEEARKLRSEIIE